MSADAHVNQAPQTISFGPLPTKTYSDAAFTLGATASSGLTVGYTSSTPRSPPFPATPSPSSAPARRPSQPAARQRNTWPRRRPQTCREQGRADDHVCRRRQSPVRLPFNPGATASPGLPVSYASSDTGVATVSGSTVTLAGVGTTTITASQPGNDNYSPPPTSRSRSPSARAARSHGRRDRHAEGSRPDRRAVCRRRDQTSGALVVPFTVSGTATSGADYTALPASVTIPTVRRRSR